MTGGANDNLLRRAAASRQHEGLGSGSGGAARAPACGEGDATATVATAQKRCRTNATRVPIASRFCNERPATLHPEATMTEKTDRAEKLVEVVAGATTAAVTTLVPMGAVLAGATSLAPAALSKFTDLLFKGAAERNARRFQMWLEDLYAARVYGDEEDFLDVLNQNIAEEWCREALIDSLRRLTSAISDDAAPIVAAISAEHLGAKKGPDWLHRAVGELVSELDASEIAAMRSLTTALAGMMDRFAAAVALRLKREVREGIAEEVIEASDLNNSAQHVVIGDLTGSERRLFALLKKHGIGEEQSGTLDAVAGPKAVVLRRSVLERLARYFAARRRS